MKPQEAAMTDVTVTADQLEGAIINALHAKDIKAVEPLLTSLALLDPYRAEKVLLTLKAALYIAKRSHDDGGDGA